MNKNSQNVAIMFMGLSVMVTGGFFAFADVQQPELSTQSEEGGMYGHVTAVVRDADGNIKQYVQSDNAILDHGKGALVEDLFGVALPGDPANDYTFVTLGTNATAVAETDSATSSFVEGSCAREDAGVSANSSIGTTDAGGSIQLNIQVEFVGSDASCANTWEQAGLYDASSAGNLFAATKLTSQVVLTTADTLTLDWDITFT